MSVFAPIIRAANVQLMEEGNAKGIGDLFDTNYIVNFGGSRKCGHRAIRGFVKTIHDAFSALSVDIEFFVESGDRISWQRTICGTQTGTFQGFPASDLGITWRDMVVSRIENDRITEEWVVSDLAEALLRSRKRVGKQN